MLPKGLVVSAKHPPWCTAAQKEGPPAPLDSGLGGPPQAVALLHMLLDKGVHRGVRDIGVSRRIVEIGDLDIAARLAVVRDEPLWLVAREVRIGVVIVVHLVGPALQPD